MRAESSWPEWITPCTLLSGRGAGASDRELDRCLAEIEADFGPLCGATLPADVVGFLVPHPGGVLEGAVDLRQVDPTRRLLHVIRAIYRLVAGWLREEWACRFVLRYDSFEGSNPPPDLLRQVSEQVQCVRGDVVYVIIVVSGDELRREEERVPLTEFCAIEIGGAGDRGFRSEARFRQHVEARWGPYPSWDELLGIAELEVRWIDEDRPSNTRSWCFETRDPSGFRSGELFWRLHTELVAWVQSGAHEPFAICGLPRLGPSDAGRGVYRLEMD